MAFRYYSAILASLLLSSLIAAPAAAVCKSPKNICKHIDECLQRTSDPNNKAAEQIREGVRTRNGRIVWAGAEVCDILGGGEHAFQERRREGIECTLQI